MRMRKMCAFLLTIAVLAALIQIPAAEAENSLYGRIIVLDAGHGAETTNVYAGYDEGAAMLKLALKLKPLLEARGAEVLLTREDKHSVSLYTRTALINKHSMELLRGIELEKNGGAENDKTAELTRLIKTQEQILEDPDRYSQVYMNAPFDYTYKREIHPDLAKIFEYQTDPEIRDRYLVISLHSNATPKPINTSTNGAIMYHISNTGSNSNYYSNYANVDRSIAFGNVLLGKISAIGIKNAGTRQDCWALIREHNLAGVLAENGFHTNKSDREKLSSDAFLDKLAVVYADAITEYFAAIDMPPSVPAREVFSALPPYTDITGNEWYFAAVKAITESAMFHGITQQLFAPNEVITRDVFITALYRFAKGEAPEGAEFKPGDVDEESWAWEPLRWALAEGILLKSHEAEEYIPWEDNLLFIKRMESGEYMFYPETFVTREEMAIMLYNYLRTYQNAAGEIGEYEFIDDVELDPQTQKAISLVRGHGIINGYDNNEFAPKNPLTRAETAQILLNLMNYVQSDAEA